VNAFTNPAVGQSRTPPEGSAPPGPQAREGPLTWAFNQPLCALNRWAPRPRHRRTTSRMPPPLEPALSKILAGPKAVEGGMVTTAVKEACGPRGCTVATGRRRLRRGSRRCSGSPARAASDRVAPATDRADVDGRRRSASATHMSAPSRRHSGRTHRPCKRWPRRAGGRRSPADQVSSSRTLMPWPDAARRCRRRGYAIAGAPSRLLR
jgi:hypothetical protein